MKHFILFIGLLFILELGYAQIKPTSTSQQPIEYVKHKVKSKETLYSISREYGITVNDLMNSNKGLDVNISIGQVILVPKIVSQNDYVIFHVTSNTNMRKVAGMYQVSQSLIKEANPDLDYSLYPGQKVKIPVGNKAVMVEEEITSEEEKSTVVEINEDEQLIAIKAFCSTLNPNYQKSFKVALMIPFYLERYDSIQKSQFLSTENEDFMSFRFIGFYEGALMAVDSLKKLGMNISLFVYDVDDNTFKTSQLLRKPELKDMDLIIGPFLNKSFDQVAKFAGMYQVPIVNPLTFRDEVIEKYSSVIKVKPKNLYQNQIVKELIKRDFPDAKVYLIKQSAYQDDGEVQNLQQILENSIPGIYKISNRKIYNLATDISKRKKINYLPSLKIEGVLINPISLENSLNDSTIFENKLVTINYSGDGFKYFMNTASYMRNSLVIIYGDNKSFVMDLMNRLNEVRDTFNIRIIGLPNWERFDNLDNNQCNDMKLIYLSSSYTGYNLPEVERFNYYFRQHYNTEPAEYAFSGFDVTYFFLYSLFYFDDHFSDCLENLEMNIFQSTYRFNRLDGTNNFENTYWNVLQYNQFRLEKVRDPIFSN